MKRCLWIPVVCGLVVVGCSKSEPQTTPSATEPAAQSEKPATALTGPAVTQAVVSNVAAAKTVAQGGLAAADAVLHTLLPGVTNEVQQVLVPAIQSAIAQLGQSGGFMSNTNVKIGMPDQLQSVEKVLRGLGQGQLPDQVIAAVNKAAETTVPVAGGALTNAAAQLKPEEVKSALTNAPGTNSLTALTDLFRQKTEPQLIQTLQPMVKNALDKSGAGPLCQQLMAKGALNPFAGATGSSSTNMPAGVESFITSKTLDGLFKVVGAKEVQIRQSLAAKAVGK